MKKKSISIILILLFSGLVFGCTSLLTTTSNSTEKDKEVQASSTNTTIQNTSSENIIISASNSSLVKIIPDLTLPFPIQKNLFSFNTGFMFTAPLEKEPAVKTITQKIKPSALRFPGGTIANYYHPDGIGYGFREEDLNGKFPDITKAMPLFDKNAIFHFADLCKMSNSDVVFVANMLTGTVEETLWCIEYFHQQNIKVVGIELGNELYLTQYRATYPTVDTYIQQAKKYAASIRKKYPNIPLGVVAGDPTESNPKGSYQKFMNQWNAGLGKEKFYDFYIPHLYSKVEVCEQKGGTDLKAVFDCADYTLAPDFYNYQQIVIDHYKQFFGNKKMWITEWNIDAGNITSNTIRHAEFVSEFLLGWVDAAEKNKQVEYLFFHNYGSGGYAAPIFSYTNQQRINYLKREGNIAYNSTYFSFLYLREIIDFKGQRIREKIAYPKGLSNQNVIFKTFYNQSTNSLFLYFINKTTKTVFFEVKGAKGITKSEGIQGKFPWSVAGWNGIHKLAPEKVDMIQYLPKNKNANDYSIPANSIGYLEIKL